MSHRPPIHRKTARQKRKKQKKNSLRVPHSVHAEAERRPAARVATLREAASGLAEPFTVADWPAVSQ